MTDLSNVQLHDLLSETLYINLDQKRSLTGKLIAIDCKANLLLDEVVEKNDGHVRKMGLVSVPFVSVRSVTVRRELVDAINALKLNISSQYV
ncbi:Mak31 [Kluyveromyces lactis]|nr:Mak31 [Kluyveromyces lactis]